jgi:hypothetical protein
MHPTAIRYLRRLEYNDLATLRGVLDASKASLSRDDDGNWWLRGSRGFITTTNGMFSVTVTAGSWR